LAAGGAAALLQYAMSPDSEIPMLGASGAISGVLGFYFVWFPRNVVRVLFLLPPFLFRVIEVPSRIVLGFFLLIDNLLPILIAREGDGVAHGAHIGGFVAGTLGAMFMDWRAVNGVPKAFPRAAEFPDAGAGDVTGALAEDRMKDAAHAYFGLAPSSARSSVS